MTNEHISSVSLTDYRDGITEVDLDFEPVYDLTPDQYNMTVNGLFNFILVILHRLDSQTDPPNAQEVAQQAHDLFVGYDDDLADILAQFIAISSDHTR